MIQPGEIICNPNTWEAKARGLEIQRQLQLHSKSESSQGFMKPCFKKQKGMEICPSEEKYIVIS